MNIRDFLDQAKCYHVSSASSFSEAMKAYQNEGVESDVVTFDVKKTYNLNNVALLHRIGNKLYYTQYIPRDGDLLGNFEIDNAKVNLNVVCNGRKTSTDELIIVSSASQYTEWQLEFEFDANDLPEEFTVSHRVYILTYSNDRQRVTRDRIVTSTHTYNDNMATVKC
jgi:hypothetical protein